MPGKGIQLVTPTVYLHVGRALEGQWLTCTCQVHEGQ